MCSLFSSTSYGCAWGSAALHPWPQDYSPAFDVHQNFECSSCNVKNTFLDVQDLVFIPRLATTTVIWKVELMPNLRRLVSNIRLSPERDDEDVAIHVANCTSNTAHVRLQKHDKSALEVNQILEESGGDNVQAGGPTKRNFFHIFRRQRASTPHGLQSDSSSEPGQTVEEFEAELQASLYLSATKANGVSASVASETPEADGSLVAKLGLRVNTASLEARRTSLESSFGDGVGSLGRYGLRPHPHNSQHTLLTPVKSDDHAPSSVTTRSLLSAHRSRPCSASATSIPLQHMSESQQDRAGPPSATEEWWTGMSENEAVQPGDGRNSSRVDPNHRQEPSSIEEKPVVESSDLLHGRDKNPFRRKPSPRDLDWSRIRGQDLIELAKGYSNVSPADSAVASPVEPWYPGKGKRPAVELPAEENAMKATRRTRDVQEEVERERRRVEEEAAERQEDDRLQALRLEEYLRLEQEEDDRLSALDLEECLRAEQEEEARLATERTRLRDCAVCGESKEPLEFPANSTMPTCNHPQHTCKECLKSWIASTLEAEGTDGIKCPECQRKLAHADVKWAASLETFEAYDTFLARNEAASDPDFAWCLASNCKNGQVNIKNNDFMECAVCNYKQCVLHRCAWHEDETCTQYEYRTSGRRDREEEQASERVMEEISKRCPGKKCGWRIEKSSGCDHITCRKCRHQFCWQCLASQEEIKRVGNTAHDRACKFHSDNLDVSWPFNAH